MWTIQQAIELCRKFETALVPKRFHVALGGSVLYRGMSGKDLDIFVYPHKSNSYKWEYAEKVLEELGVEFVRECEHAPYGDEKRVKEARYMDKRIDFFFVK